MRPATFFAGRGGATSTKDIRNDDGEVDHHRASARRPAERSRNAGGAHFHGIGSGQAPVTIEEVALKDSQSQPVAASTAALGVQIQ